MWHTGWHWPVLLLISRMRLPAWRNGCSSQVFSFFLAQVWPTWLIFMGMTWIFYEEIVPSSLFPAAVRPWTFWYTPGKGCHRLLNWQIQITKVSWVGQSTREGGGQAGWDKIPSLAKEKFLELPLLFSPEQWVYWRKREFVWLLDKPSPNHGIIGGL